MQDNCIALQDKNAVAIFTDEISNTFRKRLVNNGFLREVVRRPQTRRCDGRPGDLAGDRTHQVYFGGSKHVPLNIDAARETMPLLFELLENEKDAAVRAVSGHFIFVNIHPYMDGNGRMGRFLMNVMLTSGGYPWTVIPVEKRNEYMECLETASVNGDIRPFTAFLAGLVRSNLEGHPATPKLTAKPS